MLDWLSSHLGAQGFIPHGHCYLWKSSLVWLHVLSDAAIALSYYSIPVLLVYFVAKRRDVPFNWVFLLFGAFIIACGTGHLMEIWTLWHPTYWLAGVLKACTALISVYTALELVPLLPKLLALPSPAQLAEANRQLEQTLLRLQQTQAQLVQTEKMSSLGQLVAGIAHEINNPVNFIYGNLVHTHSYAEDLLALLSLYQQHYPQPLPAIEQAIADRDLDFIRQDFPKTISSMEVGADRIRRIVLSLRNFSRLDEAEMKPVNVHDGIDSTLLILQHRLKQTTAQSSIAIHKDYGQIPLIECYAGQLNQVFMNILSNAIDALGERRTLPQSSSESAWIRITTSQLGDDFIQISIADNGPGMSERVQQKLFDPFFTTKAIGLGTGLGLSISHQIVVEKHGGELKCRSAMGEGTTFLIKIPTHPTHLSTPPQPLACPSQPATLP